MKIAIIGAGAAGCFAAANILRASVDEVVIFEKTGKVLQKVKASGGGRCNVTHHCFDVPELITRYPRGKALLRRSLYQFPPQHTMDWFTTRGVPLKTEADGRVFPITDDSQTIIDSIWQQLQANGAKVMYHKAVAGITATSGGLLLQFTDQSTYTAQRVLVATGGFPKMEQYKWLQQTGHSIQPPVPSLFTFNTPGNPITTLMGISVPMATVKINGTKIIQNGPLLITHWGFSGPAVLKASAIAARELADRHYQFTISINWLHDVDDTILKATIQQMRQDAGKQLLWHKNPFDLPRRLWEYLLERIGIKEDVKWGELAAAAQNKLVEALLRNTYEVNGKTTFKEEFVTCGGITLSEVDPMTMQSKLVPGLYFAGEILDVDGITGGYNFQNAWSSAWIAAQNMIKTDDERN